MLLVRSRAGHRVANCCYFVSYFFYFSIALDYLLHSCKSGAIADAAVM